SEPAQSAGPTLQTSPFKVQYPRARQASEALQPSAVATHSPSRSAQAPNSLQPGAARQPTSDATQRPSLASHKPCSLHTLEAWQSPALATQRSGGPTTSVHCPWLLQAGFLRQ